MLDEPAQATRTDALEVMLGAFEGALLPLSQLQAVREQDRAALLETHALVAYARIQMHFARAGAGDARSHEACILAARAGVYVARAAGDAEEVDMLDPVVGVRLQFMFPFITGGDSRHLSLHLCGVFLSFTLGDHMAI